MGDDTPEDSKLTCTKARWAEERRFITGHTARPETERLPPGQHLVRNWPVLDLGQVPDVPRERWRLDIAGAVEAPVSWDWQGFAAQPQTRNTSDIHCVTSWSRYDNDWTQWMSALDLLDLVRPRPEAAFVVLTSSDGYTTNLALQDFASPHAILAHGWMGETLAPEHGGPVRLVVPHLYFWKSAKWLRRIEFTTSDHPGFWEVRGYHNHADPWREERYS